MPSTIATDMIAQRRAVSQLLWVSIIILILAQLLIGALSLTALNRMVAQTTADRMELSAHQSAAKIQGGLNLGKPLAQYFGLQEVLRSMQEPLAKLTGASIVLADGHVVASVGQPPDAHAVLARINDHKDSADPSVITLPSGAVRDRKSVV